MPTTRAIQTGVNSLRWRQASAAAPTPALTTSIPTTTPKDLAVASESKTEPCDQRCHVSTPPTTASRTDPTEASASGARQALGGPA